MYYGEYQGESQAQENISTCLGVTPFTDFDPDIISRKTREALHIRRHQELMNREILGLRLLTYGIVYYLHIVPSLTVVVSVTIIHIPHSYIPVL